jgi:NitT/TauT family transport system substrate-binding protein
MEGNNMRERMRKLTAAILMLVMVSVMFTACGSNSSDKSDNATQESTSEYVSEDIKVAALKGPTAIGMVKLMSDNEDNKTANNYTFQIEAAADAFTADLIKGDVQIAAMPCNAAATLYNKSNGKVSVVGINTLGVLYILDNKGEVTNVSDLKGRTIYTTGKGTTPEYTLRYLLNTNGIDPDKDVHIEFKSEASEVAAIMASAKEETVAMLPQPFATTVLMAILLVLKMVHRLMMHHFTALQSHYINYLLYLSSVFTYAFCFFSFINCFINNSSVLSTKHIPE